jgi:hypothetical protein
MLPIREQILTLDLHLGAVAEYLRATTTLDGVSDATHEWKLGARLGMTGAWTVSRPLALFADLYGQRMSSGVVIRIASEPAERLDPWSWGLALGVRLQSY